MSNEATRTEKQTVRIPRCEANWIAVVRLAPALMPIARDLAASVAVTTQLPVF